ncbi:hypothetical protein [Candidatus Oleimmundimicrobium sp.]|uniref:hypothetical protein n=1 Tax=Candidatus Oleimmundimicrobium sp. TaxID=3060597 RepID=UPI002719FA34|nr:hypothetical protein [Candidatus Oleimmundimicrobium sp.]MDO8886079.1 hypothetical protein [Candidatus Oleimmundimicrobium sp.]
MSNRKSPIIYGIYKGMIAEETRKIQECLKSSERFLKNEIEEIEKKSLEKTGREFTREEKQDLGEHYAEIYRELTEELPLIFRNSLFVLSYSTIENFLNRYCKRAKEACGLKLTLNDLKDGGIERAKNYLKKVAEIDFPENGEWAEIKHYNRIRNFIVHNDGKLDDSKKAEKVEKYIEKSDLLDLEKSKINGKVVKKTIVLKRGFCEEVLKTIKEFLFQLDDAYLSWTRKKNT